MSNIIYKGIKKIKNITTKALCYANIIRNYNPNSEIEFYLVDAFEIYHFLPYYNALKAEGVNVNYVCEPTSINTAGDWFDYKTAKDTLEKLHLDYYEQSNKNAKVALTTQYPRNLKHYSKETKKIIVTYFASLFKPTNFHLRKEVIEGYDYMFESGEIYKDYIDKFGLNTKTILTSIVKHNNFLNTKHSRAEILKELSINTDKPLLVYFPTWDEYSSIQEYADAIGELRKDFFVISKPHHCTFRLEEKKDDLDKLYKNSDIVVQGNYEFAKIASIADYSICDAKSGSVGDVPYNNNNTRLLVLMSICKDDDFIIPVDSFACVSRNINDFNECIDKLKNNDTWHDQRIEILKQLYFDKNQGFENGMNVLNELVDKYDK